MKKQHHGSRTMQQSQRMRAQCGDDSFLKNKKITLIRYLVVKLKSMCSNIIIGPLA
jgi:hypothetical protein